MTSGPRDGLERFVMRLSPLEIEHMEFPRGAGGYQRKHVRDFLVRVSGHVEELLREIQGLQEQLETAQERISQLQTAEAELQRAVIAAERIGNEIKENAKREAKLILDEAERVRDRRLGDLDGQVQQTRAEIDRLLRDRTLFREQFRGLLAAYLRSLEISTAASRLEGGHPGSSRQAAGANGGGAAGGRTNGEHHNAPAAAGAVTNGATSEDVEALVEALASGDLAGPPASVMDEIQEAAEALMDTASG